CADRLISKVRYAAPGAASFAFGQRDRPVKASTRKVRSERSSADPSRGGELRHKSGPRFLALTAIGVAFGDIGTTPLYTLQAALVATHHAEPTSADVLGIVSLIFWALMAMVSLKYVVLVLRADNDGEGGILALLLLVERITNGPGSPILVLLGMAGAALLYSGGAITPALSVLSAMEGLKLVNAPSGSGVEAMQRLINPVNLNFHAFVFNLLHEHGRKLLARCRNTVATFSRSDPNDREALSSKTKRELKCRESRSIQEIKLWARAKAPLGCSHRALSTLCSTIPTIARCSKSSYPLSSKPWSWNSPLFIQNPGALCNLCEASVDGDGPDGPRARRRLMRSA